jgi:acid phosphatase
MNYVKNIFLFSTILIYSCAPKLENLEIVKKDIREYYEGGKYEVELKEIISDAIEDFNEVKINDNSAVVFDIDETALSNYQIIKEMGYGYVSSVWNEWVHSAEAPAIEEVKNLYDTLVAKGADIIFITGRKDIDYDVSLSNLKEAGYTEFDTLITRSPSEYKMTALEYKSNKRRELIEKGYEIIGSVGDQWSDLEGGYCIVKVKVPNYLYYIP